MAGLSSFPNVKAMERDDLRAIGGDNKGRRHIFFMVMPLSRDYRWSDDSGGGKDVWSCTGCEHSACSSGSSDGNSSKHC